LPTSEQLIVTGSEDTFGLNFGLTQFEIAAKLAKPLPPIPITIDENGALTELRLEPNDSLHHAFSKGKMLYFNRIYEQQKQILQSRYDHIANEIFVANHSVYQQKGKVVSQCTLTEGLETLLPKTDHVSFVCVDGEDPRCVASGSWDRVFRIAPDLIQSVEYYPPRFRVTKFPTKAELKRIGQEDLFAAEED